jgi:DNA phosphorothioation-dependent restriction protein DptH
VSAGFQELSSTQLTNELENVAVPLLVEQLRTRVTGHCMRVSDIDAELMTRLCARLRAELPNTTVVVLTDGKLPIPADLGVSSTKLVELRNPHADGTQRQPLLVFVPSEVRASAEDSFGVATFEEVSITGLYEALIQRLIGEIPPTLRGSVQESLRRLRDSEKPWAFADALSTVRFLLTAKVNGNDAEAIGASLYEVGLVPDFEWLTPPEKAPPRLVRNRECVEKLTWSARPRRRPWARQASLPQRARQLPRRSRYRRPAPVGTQDRCRPVAMAARVQQVGIRGRRHAAGRRLHR